MAQSALAPGNPAHWRAVLEASMKNNCGCSDQGWKSLTKWQIPCTLYTYRLITHSATCSGKGIRSCWIWEFLVCRFRVENIVWSTVNRPCWPVGICQKGLEEISKTLSGLFSKSPPCLDLVSVYFFQMKSGQVKSSSLCMLHMMESKRSLHSY